MRYLSVCSGIEAASVAWESLGWEAAAFSEIEAFPRRVLAHRYPEVPLHGDFTTIQEGQYGPIDLLVGGTPCQAFSVAGLREGLRDARGNLALEYLALAGRERPRWILWENVPGVLSSNGGRDFGSFLGGLAELGYGWAYRILDAQYAGVPQRRRRVFVVGYLGDWRRAGAVLFERESLRWNPPPSRESGQGVAQALTGRPYGDRGDGDREKLIVEPYTIEERGRDGGRSLEYRQDGTTNTILTPNGGRAGIGVGAIAFAQNSRDEVRVVGGDGQVIGALSAQPGMKQTSYVAFPISTQNALRSADADASTGCGIGEEGDPSFTLTKEHGHAIAFNGTQDPDVSGDVTHPLSRNQGQDATFYREGGVRRLTPLECERLQGFPDGWTDIPGASDGARYKALGNSMAVPCMKWIGERIMLVDAIKGDIQ